LDFIHGLIRYQLDGLVRDVILAIAIIQRALVSFTLDLVVLMVPVTLLYWLTVMLIGGFSRASDPMPLKHPRHATR
jgi:hypothetical protein